MFPLYVYMDDDGQGTTLDSAKKPNFSSRFLGEIKNKLGKVPNPKSIFGYIYAVFHSPTYRSRYAEFLKLDFPRIPLISNNKLFEKLAIFGEELISLHLMRSKKLGSLITQFEENSDRTVASGYPKYVKGKVTINKSGGGFTRVPEKVWNFHIGGYQVCHKWLKDRKGRTLNDDDILHYQRIIVALKETIELMQKIDDAIPSWPIE